MNMELEKILEEIDNLYVDETDFGIECNMENSSNIACDNCYECIKEACKNMIRNHMNDGWIPVDDRMPEEHSSIFAKFKGTTKWNNAMFETCSNEVNITIEDDEGKSVTAHAHTNDGKWKCDLLRLNPQYHVTAWRPLPEPYRPERN